MKSACPPYAHGKACQRRGRASSLCEHPLVTNQSHRSEHSTLLVVMLSSNLLVYCLLGHREREIGGLLNGVLFVRLKQLNSSS